MQRLKNLTYPYLIRNGIPKAYRTFKWTDLTISWKILAWNKFRNILHWLVTCVKSWKCIKRSSERASDSQKCRQLQINTPLSRLLNLQRFWISHHLQYMTSSKRLKESGGISVSKGQGQSCIGCPWPSGLQTALTDVIRNTSRNHCLWTPTYAG